jgi:hypothetical protein
MGVDISRVTNRIMNATVISKAKSLSLITIALKWSETIVK